MAMGTVTKSTRIAAPFTKRETTTFFFAANVRSCPVEKKSVILAISLAIVFFSTPCKFGKDKVLRLFVAGYSQICRPGLDCGLNPGVFRDDFPLQSAIGVTSGGL